MFYGLWAGIAAGALWGLVFIAPRMVPALSAVDLMAGRFVSYGAVSFAVMFIATKPVWPTANQTITVFGLSVLGFSGYYLLLILAIRDAGTEVPSLIIGTIPLWMMLLGKPVSLRWGGLLPGFVLTFLGLGLMMTQTQNGVPSASGHHFWRGVSFAIGAMICWTAFGLLNAAWLKRHSHISATTWANWLGLSTGASALALWLIAGSDANLLLSQPTLVLAALTCIATGIGSAWLATILWNIASQRLSSSLCGQLIVSETLFALFYSFLWDGLWPTQLQMLACVLFVAGILASIKAHR